jgi:hypothetical protein
VVQEGGLIGVVHVHSTYSHDGRDSLAELRAFALARGLRFVGLTDHAEDLDAARFEELRDECGRLSDDAVRLLPGLEFRFDGFPGVHLLALGLDRWIRPRTFEEFFASASEAADLTIAAHPLLYRWRLPDVVAQRIDAIEVWNTGYNTRYLPDPRAIRLLERVRKGRPDVVAIAGLDQHDSRNYREAHLVLDAERCENPLVEIRAGRFHNRGLRYDFDSHATLSPTRMLILQCARTGLDVVNAIHERGMRSLRAARS